MSNASRKARGTETQILAAEWWRGNGFPYCTDAGAGRTGRDLLNLTGLAGEVKGRAGFDPMAWIRQAKSNAEDGEIPFVQLRCNGQGPASIADWPVLLRTADFTFLVRRAGFGTPLEEIA